MPNDYSTGTRNETGVNGGSRLTHTVHSCSLGLGCPWLERPVIFGE